MKKTSLTSPFVFGLLLCCIGCTPVLAKPGGSGYPGPSDYPGVFVTPTASASPTPLITAAPTSRLVTPIIATPRTVKETVIYPFKPTQPWSSEFSLASGEKLSLTGGLTEEARSLLQSGETGYFLLHFSTMMDATQIQPLTEAGITPLTYVGGVFAEVPPSALETLETWSRDGFLLFGGPLPPAGKISARLVEAVRASPNESIQVTVFLFKRPDEAEKQRLEALFDETNWPRFIPESGVLFGGDIQGSNVATLSEIPVVYTIEEVPVSTLP